MRQHIPAITRQYLQDVKASQKLFNEHMEELNKAINESDWPKACSKLRAIQLECTHALDMTSMLSVDDVLKLKPRFLERGQS